MGRTWNIINTDSGEQVEGDFEAVGVTRNVTTSYAQHTSLNRQNAVTQFLHGNADTLSFAARLYQRDALTGVNIEEKYEKLVEWTKRDPDRGRPAIVLFYVGDASTAYGDFFSTIESISDAVFDSPTVLGAVRGISFAVNLRQFTEFDIEKGTEGGNTRYHNVKAGEYMELIAAREYGEPLLGDLIRKAHPKLPIPQTADKVGLPALRIIRSTPVVPRSIQLTGLVERRDNANKDLRVFHQERLNRTYRSAIIPEGL